MKILDPTLDIVFKLLFGDPRSKRILIALLTAVIQPKSPIADVTVFNPGIPKQSIKDKDIVLDLLVRFENGTLADIEMQAYKRPVFLNRSLYYWSRTYADQIGRGHSYTKLKPVISVIFTAYRQFDVNRLHSTFHMLEIHDHVRFNNDFELHFVELPRIYDKVAMSKARLEVQQWARFLGAKTNQERHKVAKEDPMVSDAHKLLIDISSDEELQNFAKEREIGRRFYEMDVMLIREEAEAEGERRGERRGERKGKREGKREGRAQGKRETILQLLAMRKIELTPKDRAALMACNRISTLDKLVEKAMTMQPGEPLFDTP